MSGTADRPRASGLARAVEGTFVNDPDPSRAPAAAPGPATAPERGAEPDRLARLRSLDEQIGEALRESQARGELQAAPSWGRPLKTDDGFEETPVEWRMPFKILKDAGVVPPEVELMHEIRALQRAADEATTTAEREALLRRVADRRQHLALRLERFGRNGRE